MSDPRFDGEVVALARRRLAVAEVEYLAALGWTRVPGSDDEWRSPDGWPGSQRNPSQKVYTTGHAINSVKFHLRSHRATDAERTELSPKPGETLLDCGFIVIGRSGALARQQIYDLETARAVASNHKAGMVHLALIGPMVPEPVPVDAGEPAVRVSSPEV